MTDTRAARAWWFLKRNPHYVVEWCAKANPAPGLWVSSWNYIIGPCQPLEEASLLPQEVRRWVPPPVLHRRLRRKGPNPLLAK